MKNVFLIGVCCMLVSCNVQRLFTFKRQLSMVDRYFIVDQPGIIQFVQPILMQSDIEFLTGIHPTQYTCQTNSICVAEYDFIQSDTQFFRYQLIFVDGRLAQIEYPDAFINFVSKSFATQLLSSIGQANLVANQSIKAVKTTPAVAPMKADIEEAFGPATQIQEFPTVTYALYEYAHPTDAGTQHVSMAFLYSKIAGNIDMVFIHLPRMRWSIDMRDF